MEIGDLPPDERSEGVWPENASAVEAFLAVASQWRVLALPTGLAWLGLDFAGARAGLELAGIEVTPELWADLRIVAIGAKDEMNG